MNNSAAKNLKRVELSPPITQLADLAGIAQGKNGCSVKDWWFDPTMRHNRRTILWNIFDVKIPKKQWSTVALWYKIEDRRTLSKM